MCGWIWVCSIDGMIRTGGNPKHSGNSLPHCHLVTTGLTQTGLGSILCVRMWDDKYVFYWFSANLQSTLPGAISKCGDWIVMRGEVVQWWHTDNQNTLTTGHKIGTNKCRVIKKSLCTWWLQNRKLQVMFKVSPASLQTFIDTPNCVLEDRVQHSTTLRR
jgi:hypothetical protein